jgi:hypothetical protein
MDVISQSPSHCPNNLGQVLRVHPDNGGMNTLEDLELDLLPPPPPPPRWHATNEIVTRRIRMVAFHIVILNIDISI